MYLLALSFTFYPSTSVGHRDLKCKLPSISHQPIIPRHPNAKRLSCSQLFLGALTQCQQRAPAQVIDPADHGAKPPSVAPAVDPAVGTEGWDLWRLTLFFWGTNQGLDFLPSFPKI